MCEVIIAINKIMKELSAIGKEQKNTSQGWNYRGIDQVYNALNPLMAKHGLVTMPEVLEEKTVERVNKNGTALFYSTLKVKYSFYAGNDKKEVIIIGKGMDSGDKDANKALAIAHKYALLQVFCIPTEDIIDPDKESHEVEPIKKAEKQELPKGNFDSAMKAIASCKSIVALNDIASNIGKRVWSDIQKETLNQSMHIKSKEIEGVKNESK